MSTGKRHRHLGHRAQTHDVRGAVSNAHANMFDDLLESGLANPPSPGRPAVIWRWACFWILHNGTHAPLRDVPLATLKVFRDDARGSHEPVIDCENLTTQQYVAFMRLLEVFIAAESAKADGEMSAAAEVPGEQGPAETSCK